MDTSTAVRAREETRSPAAALAVICTGYFMVFSSLICALGISRSFPLGSMGASLPGAVRVNRGVPSGGR